MTNMRLPIVLLLLIWLVGSLGASAAQSTKKLEKVREEHKKRAEAYRAKVDDYIRRVEEDVTKAKSLDLSKVFKSELEFYRAGGPPPAVLRKNYQKDLSDTQKKLVTAQNNLESALLDARRDALAAKNQSTVTALDAELKTLREKWIVGGEPAATVALVLSAEAPNPQVWQYTTADPGLSWAEPDFKPQNWLEGRAGFASPRMGNIKIGTTWTQERIWLRKMISVPRTSPNDVFILRLRFDEDAELFINGVLLLKAPGYNGGYDTFFLDSKQRGLFREGVNTLGVFCRNNGGGQAIDLSLTMYRGASDVVADVVKDKGVRDPDDFEVGAIWDGQRMHKDPVTPGETLSTELEVLQRMGNKFLARLITRGPNGEGSRLVPGELKEGRLEIIEPTSLTNSLKLDGEIKDRVWKYGFRGNGALGAERYGDGEMKPRTAR